MFTVLIVDDEPWVAYGLTRLIDWEQSGFTIIGQAHDGLTALRMIQEEEPDVIISDIRMPGLDGIALLDRMVQAGIDAEVIFVSGYAEFEYARDALRLGAFDYLVKQVERPKLVETMSRCLEKLQEKRRRSGKERELLVELFELFDPKSEAAVGDLLRSKGYASEMAGCRFATALGAPMDGREKDVLLRFRNEGVTALSFRTGIDKLSYLLLFHHADKLKDNEASRLVSRCLGEFDALGISGIGDAQASVGKLYLESDIALFSRLTLGSNCTLYQPAEPASDIGKWMLQLELAVKEGKTGLIFDRLDKLMENCKTNRLYIDQFSKLFNQMVSVIHKYQNQSGEVPEPEYMNYSQIGRSFETLEGLFEFLKACFEQPAKPESDFSNGQILSIIQQIEVAYTQDISLGQWAKEFNISLGHLSYLFKRETGQTYSEYVTDKRLQLAKDLLGDPELSIQEVVDRVGYKDYFHFNKLFKKHFGVTPSKYRKI
ncbi:response regulator [Paenibacillus sp. CAU 1782]